MPLSPRAQTVYGILVSRCRTMARPQITYEELAAAIGTGMVPRSKHIADALYEIGFACRDTGLPILTAVVVEKASGRPSKGYFEITDRPFMLEIEASKRAAWPETLTAARPNGATG